VLSSISGTRTRALQAAGSDLRHALTGGDHLAFVVAALASAAALLLAAVVLRSTDAEPQPVLAEDLAEMPAPAAAPAVEPEFVAWRRGGRELV
jgi:hypothetical protein